MAPYFPIIGGTSAERVLQELVEFSKKKENWFGNPEESSESAKLRTGTGPQAEGHHVPHTRHITVSTSLEKCETYHVTFTITKGRAISLETSETVEVLVRHATIGVGDLERTADIVEMFTISRFLGFRSPDPQVMIHPEVNAVVLLEEIPPEEAEQLRAA